MLAVLLLAHHLVAVFLLGAVTHQALATLLPSRSAETSFSEAFRRVNPSRYATAIAVSFTLMLALGALLYPAYRIDVRGGLLDQHYPHAAQLFELKEHFTAIAFGLLPFYCSVWRRTEDASNGPCNATTLLIALVVWWDFLVGHALVSIKGLM